MENKKLVLKCESPIRSLTWTGKWVGATCDDEHGQIYDTVADKMFMLKNGHSGSAKSISIDPLCEFVATSGCDGHINIYSVPENEESSPQFI
jgi:WD40 repeat protein